MDSDYRGKNRAGKLEKDFIQQAYRKSGGNKAETARMLNMPRTNIINRMKKYGIE